MQPSEVYASSYMIDETTLLVLDEKRNENQYDTHRKNTPQKRTRTKQQQQLIVSAAQCQT